MSETQVKLSELPPEQRAKVKKAFSKFIFRNVLSGMNVGALLVASNLVIMLADKVYWNSKPLSLVLCIMADVYLIHSMRLTVKRNAAKLREDVTAIIKK